VAYGFDIDLFAGYASKSYQSFLDIALRAYLLQMDI